MRRLITALPIAIAGAALAATILRPHSVPAWVVALLAGAIPTGTVAAMATGRRLLFTMLGELFVVVVGGPIAAGLVVGVQGMVEHGGVKSLVVGPIVFGVLGIPFGAFITIPIGLAFAGLCTGWAALVGAATRESAKDGAR